LDLHAWKWEAIMDKFENNQNDIDSNEKDSDKKAKKTFGFTFHESSCETKSDSKNADFAADSKPSASLGEGKIKRAAKKILNEIETANDWIKASHLLLGEKNYDEAEFDKILKTCDFDVSSEEDESKEESQSSGLEFTAPVSRKVSEIEKSGSATDESDGSTISIDFGSSAEASSFADFSGESDENSTVSDDLGESQDLQSGAENSDSSGNFSDDFVSLAKSDDRFDLSSENSIILGENSTCSAELGDDSDFLSESSTISIESGENSDFSGESDENSTVSADLGESQDLQSGAENSDSSTITADFDSFGEFSDSTTPADISSNSAEVFVTGEAPDSVHAGRYEDFDRDIDFLTVDADIEKYGELFEKVDEALDDDIKTGALVLDSDSESKNSSIGAKIGTIRDKFSAAKAYLTNIFKSFSYDDFDEKVEEAAKNYTLYEILGSHAVRLCGESGYIFSVWAPNAKNVELLCKLNEWGESKILLQKFKHGVWSTFVPNFEAGSLYRYKIETQSGKFVHKSDPFAFFSEKRPNTNSITYDITGYKWSDSAWLKKRADTAPYDKPMNIYEVHFGSWKRHEDGSFLTYREMKQQLIPYVKYMGYTHIELMPMAQVPYDGSWGYQVTGYYSINSCFGEPKEFMEFIDECHKNDIGVIIDWTAAHFPRDSHGLARFDGTPLYEYADPKIGEHPEWGTLVFNWGKPEVLSFLISNANFLFQEFHVDGLRVDGVSSMLYLDYGRKDGEWVPNKYGGKENLDAIEFFHKLNEFVFGKFPNILMIAEESTAWPKVTHPVYNGGLGFNFKWNMGWMNDSLRYASMDPCFRKDNHKLINFSMFYAYSENFILVLSHDEVVHGKKSMIDKMFGTYDEKFATLRMFYAYMFAHPGKKLNFMGNDFGQFIEWRYYEGLEWKLLNFEKHRRLSFFVRELNLFYRSHKAFFENDQSWEGFKWINPDDSERSILPFIRIDKSGSEKIVVVSNFTPVEYSNYVIGVPESGTYKVIFDTSNAAFGGTRRNTDMFYTTKSDKFLDFDHTLSIEVPKLATLYIKKVGPEPQHDTISVAR
jgi:1,4-alpha-glucan branching enzyme